MNESEATVLAQKIWGPSKGFARITRVCTLEDQRRANEECQRTHGFVVVQHTGPVTGVMVGYHRKTRNGNPTCTWLSAETFEEAFSKWSRRSIRAREVMDAFRCAA